MLATELFDISASMHPDLWSDERPAWAVLDQIAPYLEAWADWARHSDVSRAAQVGERVFIGRGCQIDAGAVILGPAWIGNGCHIRAGAYVRENVIAEGGCVLGNSSEFKNCVMLPGCQVPHFNYVGDSVLGVGAHLGAGAILSNFRLDAGEIFAAGPEGERLATGRNKFGALIGDRAEIGCHSVLNPGSIIGRRSVLYPGTLWRGTLPAGQIVKVRQTQQIVAEK